MSKLKDRVIDKSADYITIRDKDGKVVLDTKKGIGNSPITTKGKK